MPEPKRHLGWWLATAALLCACELVQPTGEAGSETAKVAQPVRPLPAPSTAAPAPPSPSPAPVATPEDEGPAPLQVTAVADASLRTADEANTISVFEAVAPATVFVTQKKAVVDRWSRQALEVPAGTGTGFIWDDAGHVVTNFHVVDGATSLEVTLFGDQSFPARFIGGDRTKDLAVLALEVPDSVQLTPIQLPPREAELVVGQKTLAIGNPFGLDHTLTTGVISALGREVGGYGGVTIRDMIQTDASINPGNSGGPLLNSRGELIGVNTMIHSNSGQSAGIGFAVPVSTVARVVPQIIAHGAPLRAGLGVNIVPDAITRNNGIAGVVIESVPRGTPADAAGLRGLRRTRRGTLLGDVIVGLDGVPIRKFDDLFTELDKRRPGDEVTLQLRREGGVFETRLELTTVRGG